MYKRKNIIELDRRLYGTSKKGIVVSFFDIIGEITYHVAQEAGVWGESVKGQ